MHDGFGNLWQQNVTKGTAPTLSIQLDQANNRILGGSYDANGNQSSNSAVFDIDNRLTEISVYGYEAKEQYNYLADNKRVWKKEPSGTEFVYFYGVGGQKLATYQVATSPSFALNQMSVNVYFGGKLIRADGVAVAADRLGSVMGRAVAADSSSVTSHDYFPYGAEIGGATAGNRDKFGTYHRDQSTGLDNADQRYFSSGVGRFHTSDPLEESGQLSSPSSWNRYTYALADPINGNDPSGLITCGNLPGADGVSTVRSAIMANSDTGKIMRLVWHEGGSLRAAGSAGNLNAMHLGVARALLNRQLVTAGKALVLGRDGNAYWGAGYKFFTCAPFRGCYYHEVILSATTLGYGPANASISQIIVRAAAGTNVVNSNGDVVDRIDELERVLNVEHGDPFRPLPGRIAVNVATQQGPSRIYVTEECYAVISAIQQTTRLLQNPSLGNSTNYFITSWKTVGTSSSDTIRLKSLGVVGALEFFGPEAWAEWTYPEEWYP